MHFRPPNEQNEYKVTCGLAVTVLPKVLMTLSTLLEEGGVRANVIVSGIGDWRCATQGVWFCDLRFRNLCLGLLHQRSRVITGLVGRGATSSSTLMQQITNQAFARCIRLLLNDTRMISNLTWSNSLQMCRHMYMSWTGCISTLEGPLYLDVMDH